jgi:hypothetical protein
MLLGLPIWPTWIIGGVFAAIAILLFVKWLRRRGKTPIGRGGGGDGGDGPPRKVV